jgi:hypothetical protein
MAKLYYYRSGVQYSSYGTTERAATSAKSLKGRIGGVDLAFPLILPEESTNSYLRNYNSGVYSIATNNDYFSTSWGNVTSNPAISFMDTNNAIYYNGMMIFQSSSGGGTYYTSSDGGANWTSRTSPVNVNGSYLSIVNGNLIFQVLTNSYYYVSTDGINWSSQRTFSGYTINSSNMGYCGGNYVVSTNTATYFYTSTDLVNWTQRTSSALPAMNLTFVTGNNITVGYQKGSLVSTVYYSTDNCMTWTSAAVGYYVTRMTFGDGVFVTTASGGGVTYLESTYSTNGSSWTYIPLPLSAYWHCISYGNGTFMAVAAYNAGGWGMQAANASISIWQRGLSAWVDKTINSGANHTLIFFDKNNSRFFVPMANTTAHYTRVGS